MSSTSVKNPSQNMVNSYYNKKTEGLSLRGTKLVAPSILSADFANLETEVKRLESWGADWIHIDVMDGQFVPNLTIGAPVVKALKKVSSLPLDVHLMIIEPERYLQDFIDAGADILTIHMESTVHIQSCLKKIKAAGVKPGLTLKPATEVETLYPYLDHCEMVLVMTVNPGFGGQSFMSDQIKKIQKLREQLDKTHPHILIEVDGGINAETVKWVQDADIFVAGNYIFSNPGPEAIQKLKGL